MTPPSPPSTPPPSDATSAAPAAEQMPAEPARQPQALTVTTFLAPAQRENLIGLMDIGRALTGAIDLDHCLQMIVELTSEVLDAERSSIFLYDPKTHELISKVAEGIEDSKEIRFPADKGLAGAILKTGQTLNIPDAYADERFNRETDRSTGFRTRNLMGAPLIGRGNRTIGVIEVLNRRSPGPFTPDDEQLLEGVAGQCGVALENARLLSDIDALFEAFIAASSQAIDQRDPTTAGHSRRVTRYTLNLARAVHFCAEPPFEKVTYTRQEMRQLRYAGLLHDFGKIGVREAVLCKARKLPPGGIEWIEERIRRMAADKKLAALQNLLIDPVADPMQIKADADRIDAEWNERLKFVLRVHEARFTPDEDVERLKQLHADGTLTARELEHLSVRRGNLTLEEWEDMKSHVSKSFQVLHQIPWPETLHEVPRIAHGHHEKLDGSGYPLGIRQGEIHFDSEIMCVADIYDALTAADRPYKKAMTHDQAMKILNEEAAAGKLNADLVRLFERDRCFVIEGMGDTRHSIFKEEVPAQKSRV
ncbi:MAG: HD domain-containing phosphohydrolase [Planctomycetota bacterium]